MPLKNDAIRPLFAIVGAGDFAVEVARSYAADVQTRFKKVELQPKSLRDQALTLVVTGVDSLSKDAREAQARFETRVAAFQTEALALPERVEAYVNETVEELVEGYGDLAARGKTLLTRIRRQQASQEAQAAAENTVAQAKTARTQTTKSAKKTAGTAKRAAGSTRQGASKTGATAKRNTKATKTSARKTASATARAAGDAAEKVGD